MTRTYADGIEDADPSRRLHCFACGAAEIGSQQCGCKEFRFSRETFVNIAAAIRTLSTSPSGIEDAREALTAASEIVAWWPDEIDLVRHIRTAPSRKGIDIARHVLAYFEPAHRLATLCESASSKIGGDQK